MKNILHLAVPYYAKGFSGDGKQHLVGAVELSIILHQDEGRPPYWEVQLQELEIDYALTDPHTIFVDSPFLRIKRRMREPPGIFLYLLYKFSLVYKHTSRSTPFLDRDKHRLQVGNWIGFLSFQLDCASEREKLENFLEIFAHRVFEFRRPKTAWQLSFEFGDGEIKWDIVSAKTGVFGTSYRWKGE